MPVDLSPAGVPSAYPPHGPRFWPWLGIWFVCNVVGASLMLLLWGPTTSARGFEFWIYVFGIPNAVFMVLLGIDRGGYEALWIRAHFRNIHRRKWIVRKVCEAQQPLQVLGVGYSMPLDGHSLAAAMAARKAVPKVQPPRKGTLMIVHNRFDEPGLSAEPPDVHPEPDESASADPTAQPHIVATIVLKMAQALGPLVTSLLALSQYESIHWPQVRVLAAPEEAALREAEVRVALRIAGLPALACLAVQAADGLLVADAWLDAHERRPLLVIAAQWYDAAPPEGSTEGCVAVLLSPGFYRLPEPVTVIGTLHRPVAGALTSLRDLLAKAALWGKVHGPEVTRAWISGLAGEHDTALLAGLRDASLSGIAKLDAQHRPDRIVGDAGAANGWLSIAAAVESGETGPQLILNHVQAAILYVHPPLTHDSPVPPVT